EFQVVFAGVPFNLDLAKAIRVRSSSNRHQTEVDLVEELNRLLAFKDFNEFAETASYPGRNLGALANLYKPGMAGNMEVGIGNWFYPNGAARWSVFRGLVTSSQVAAMLAATGGT